MSIPEAAQDVWTMFQEIAATRGSTGFGPLPIPAAEILAWSQLKRRRITPWEFEMIRMLDQTFLRVFSECQPKPRGRHGE